MSDELEQQDQIAVPDQNLDKPDDREPDDARQGELRAIYEQNMEAGKPPYDNAWIRTFGELAWIVRERQWAALQMLGGVARPDFRGADFTNTDLRGANLIRGHFDKALFHRTNLDDAVLDDSTLINAILFDASLIGASFLNANLTGASLANTVAVRANLINADLRNANLQNADLREASLAYAQLDGANLTRADVRATDLRRSRTDSATVLREIILSQDTCMGDVVWNGVPLTEVRWEQAKRLGDEKWAKERKEHPDHIVALGTAARAYRGLSVALRSQGLLREASAYRLREQRLERARSRADKKYGAVAFSWVLDVTSGYGESLRSIGATYAIVVLAFTIAYWLATHFLETKLSALSLDEAFILSVTSFHGRGFFPSYLTLGDWVARFGAAEALIGLFIEILLIATFTRRFLGN